MSDAPALGEVRTIPWENGLEEERVIRAGDVAAAVFSPDRAYRYLLRRTWEPLTESLLFVMLNPSTANALVDDHTIRRCTYYAKRHRYGGMSVVNLFALRATDPRQLLEHPDPAGPDNWRVLTTLAIRDPGRLVVAAWGAYDRRLGMFGDQVALLFTERGHTLHRLGTLTAAGYPRHPARLANDVELEVYRPGRPIVGPDPFAGLIVPDGLQPCHAAGMCPRLVSIGVRYCCGACGDGWEAVPRYEAEHTESCDARWAERQPSAVARG